ncbi:Xanthine dehydrogenase [Colletotrichum sp. SAR11_239]|nr:Xanthine dehydrogenase [Colletotrichum sp. SAR11_239]
MSMPAPSKPLGALDFSQVTYGNKAQRFTAQTNLARLILAEKLQAFQEINALAKITFAEGNSTDPDPVWIDARSTPVKLLDSAPTEVGAPAFELTWPPERFENLTEGRDDPQTAVFMSAVPTTGDYPLAIRFADLMTPNPTASPKTAKELPLEELPKPTEDIDQVKRDLRRWGYGLLKNALTPEQVAILKKASQEQAAGERNAGVATFDGGPKKPNQRIWNIFNKGEEFLDLLNHPLIDEVVPWYLGCNNPLLWSYNINIARPGGTPQVLHWDQGIMGHGRTKAVALNISWLLCDFTETNGGTRIFPGSHNQNVRPRNVFSSEGSIACEAPAGTAMIFEGRIWHGTGQNTETSGERPCILSLFTHPAVRPKENALLALSWEAEDEVLSERHKSLAALRTGQAGVGGALGEAREGIIVKRPRSDFTTVGKLRAPHDDAEVAQMLATGTHANNAQSADKDTRPDTMAPIAISPERDAGPLNTLTTDFDDTIRFYLNGTRVVLDEIDPEVTLLEYLRGIGLTGTKLGCGEGGCGACTVVISQFNPTTKQIYHASVNACLAPLASVDGKHVITIEGIGNTKAPHPAQERVAKTNGSQCGFCTPGIVMSLYALLRNNQAPSEEDIEEAFDGNLCRCTGYKPILEAAQTFSVERGCGKARTNGGSGCCMENGNGEKKAGGCCMDKAADDQPIKRFTPPGFIEYKPDTELIFPPMLKKHEMRPLAFGNKRKRWFRPVTLSQLLDIKSVYPSAKIIGGSTETQIEIKFKAQQYPVSVFVGDIAELRQYEFKDDHLEIGGNVILTDLEHISQEATKHYGETRGQVFEAIFKQLKYFAGRQIRNVGTPAGNLATASPISDLNPVLWAANAVLVAKSQSEETEIPMSQFFTGYRKTALAQDAIIASIRIPVTASKGEFFRAYKQAKRKDDDIAIVTGALRIKVDDDGVVTESNLIYGGMAAMTVAAKKTMEYLIGKRIAELETLEGAMDALGEDFNLQFSVPGGMASYRKALALSFFYRFYHDVLAAMDAQSQHVDKEAIEEIERGISGGHEDHDAAVAYEQETVGRSKSHVAALKQVTGEAQYIDDIPSLKNELHGCFVLSSKAHAKIKSVDYSAALDMPGVVEYVDINDVETPEQNRWGAPHFDEAFFAEGEVFTAGQPIAMMLATSANRAAEAARAVKVEYEELPTILSIEEAIEQDSFHNYYREIKNGDTEEAFKNCDHIFTGTARMGGQEHFYLETQASLVVPKPEDGEMEVFSGTQNANETQVFVARMTGVAANKIVVRVKRLGGGFGGKETRSVQVTAPLALAAKKTKRPCRYMLTREEDMVTSGQRHPFLGRWKVGVNKDGKIQALDLDVFNNAGWSFDLSAAVCERAMSHSDGCYRIPNVFIRGRLCKTNTMSNTAFRGFGGPQGMFIAETYMEEVADRMGIPVEKFREINFYKPLEPTHFNQPLTDWHVPLMYEQVQEESKYEQRREMITKFNDDNKWRKRGLALIPTKFGISFTALFLNQAGALVHIYHDGSVLVAHGGTEMGQGLHTKMTQIAAQALEVPLDNVFISETATNTVANASATAASASSDLNGYAIYNACAQLNERLAPYREKLGPKATMKDLAHAAYFDRVNLSVQGFYKTPEIGYTWGENRGKMFFYFTQGVTAAEVEIDTLTGTWTCIRADIKMDVGQSINPAIDYGQIQGAFVQGLGLFTVEESLWLRNGPMAGNLFTRGPGAYKIPGFRDIPQEFNVSLLKDVEWKDLRTIQRSRGVGEPPLFMGSAVFFAIRDALKAARRQYGVQATVGEDRVGDGLLRLESPATPERIRLSCEDPIMRRARVLPKEGEKSFFVAI